MAQHAVSHNDNKQLQSAPDSTLSCKLSLLWPRVGAMGIQATY